MRKIVGIYMTGAKGILTPNIFTACNQLDAFAMLVDILENEIEEGKQNFTDEQIRQFFASGSAEFGNEKLFIIDWDGESCPIQTANKFLMEKENITPPKKKKVKS